MYGADANGSAVTTLGAAVATPNELDDVANDIGAPLPVGDRELEGNPEGRFKARAWRQCGHGVRRAFVVVQAQRWTSGGKCKERDLYEIVPTVAKAIRGKNRDKSGFFPSLGPRHYSMSFSNSGENPVATVMSEY